ncbi:hypothetical protein HL033_00285 [Neoehrlichia mikurensis]|uniref:Uncharacterized protein n=1 Tax=Neoehrlichia mikurensis TaxID=89586 RepID=A0A9Q9BXT3_9RICK|nr:hypothetical protein [Neoehrlichia mikurensis]QXK92016.1 hypothetical protein IAH97_00285 [Neoehrlichia mikurensis]QXK92474.1 hypothetical protein HUN61_00285 [Neoehrlichia mikurensis]QXK93709.1 hypothetical protein HL033_00285 [Neoehrlichia mikurensis]UTO55318.1 hypothetical protein LUA82_04000 [Neoehrlichia mikurensis]UTO56238.1 hypothetical protein LUA81_03965 [Neoehrlichia mikurensis]
MPHPILIMSALNAAASVLCIITLASGSRTCSKANIIMGVTLLFVSAAIIYAFTIICYKAFTMLKNKTLTKKLSDKEVLAELQKSHSLLIIDPIYTATDQNLNNLIKENKIEVIKVIKTGQQGHRLIAYFLSEGKKEFPCKVIFQNVSMTSLKEIIAYKQVGKLCFTAHKKFLKNSNPEQLSQIIIQITKYNSEYRAFRKGVKSYYPIRGLLACNATLYYDNEVECNIMAHVDKESHSQSNGVLSNYKKIIAPSHTFKIFYHFDKESHSQLNDILSVPATNHSLNSYRNIASILFDKYINNIKKGINLNKACLICKEYRWLILHQDTVLINDLIKNCDFPQSMLNVIYQNLFVDALSLYFDQNLQYSKLYNIMNYNIDIHNNTQKISHLIQQELQNNEEFALAVIIATSNNKHLSQNSRYLNTNTALSMLLSNHNKELQSQIQQFFSVNVTLPNNKDLSHASRIIQHFIQGKFVRQYSDYYNFKEMPVSYFIQEIQVLVSNYLKNFLFHYIAEIAINRHLDNPTVQLNINENIKIIQDTDGLFIKEHSPNYISLH